MVKEPIHVTDGAFEKAVLQSPIPVLVDFWAPWCSPCRMVAPTLEKLAAEYQGKMLVAKVNTDENQQWAVQYGVQGIPTLLFVVDGQAVGQLVGAHPYPTLKNAMEQVLAYAEKEKAKKEKVAEEKT
ncbi:MAG: thioredoxin [Anaerolineae bacterium]|nr:thioredoxin [Anaerolineae bacterium]